jgi:hypothetical protein
MHVLIDADTILELLLSRNDFIDEVKSLEEFIKINSLKFYITKLGLGRIREYLKIFFGGKISSKMTRLLKKSIEILPINSSIACEALNKPIRDIDSAIEFTCAEMMGIGAIITHKPNDFDGASSLQILNLSQLRQRYYLEKGLTSNEHPSILNIENWKEIEYLNRVFCIKTNQNNLEKSQFSPKCIENRFHELPHKIFMQKNNFLCDQIAGLVESPAMRAASLVISAHRDRIAELAESPAMRAASLGISAHRDRIAGLESPAMRAVSASMNTQRYQMAKFVEPPTFRAVSANIESQKYRMAELLGSTAINAVSASIKSHKDQMLELARIMDRYSGY